LTDFYTLLKQSILERRITDPARRKAIYGQARSALVRQLTAQQPKLSDPAIASRATAFDRAIQRVEAELAVEFANAGDDGYDDNPTTVEREATGWDVRDEAVEDEDPSAPIEPEDPLYTPRSGRGRDVSLPRGVALADIAEPDDGLLPPVPYRDQWTDEEAVLREDDGEAPPVVQGGLPPPRRRLGWTLSETDKVRVLIGAIGALALILIGLLVYLFLPGRDAGVTLPINSRGSVSDAATANRIAGQTLDVKQSFIVFDGGDPTIFQASSDNPVHLDNDATGAFARIGTSTASTGVKVQIGPGLASRLAGQNIRVVVTARASAERGALNMRFAYQSGIALSHWQTANLSPAYADAGMTWIVPQLRTSANGADYLLIEPGIPGDGTYADVGNIRIDLLGSAPTS
jgi:hypothetical protein